MKKLFLALLMVLPLLFFAQNKAILCGDFDKETGVATGINELWDIKKDGGGYVYLLYSQDKTIRESLKVVVEKFNAGSKTYKTYKTYNFDNKLSDFKKFAMYDLLFTEEGKYNLKIYTTNDKFLTETKAEIFYLKEENSNTSNFNINYKFTKIEPGYDHVSKIVVFVDGDKVGESNEQKQSISGNFSTDLKEGNHDLEIEVWVKYKGVWEKHIKTNDFHTDMVIDKKINIKDTKKLTLNYEFNLDDGPIELYEDITTDDIKSNNDDAEVDEDYYAQTELTVADKSIETLKQSATVYLGKEDKVVVKIKIEDDKKLKVEKFYVNVYKKIYEKGKFVENKFVETVDFLDIQNDWDWFTFTLDFDTKGEYLFDVYNKKGKVFMNTGYITVK